MWNKWKARFNSLGSSRLQFQTSTRGGKSAGKKITGAKCLLFFDMNKNRASTEVNLENIIGMTLCSQRFEVTFHKEENFEFQMKDKEKSATYGTKVGNPILEFNPTDAQKCGEKINIDQELFFLECLS